MFAALLTFNVTTTDFSLGGLEALASGATGDLKCNDITSCTTSAGCGSAGTAEVCVLSCDNGTTVFCPYDE